MVRIHHDSNRGFVVCKIEQARQIRLLPPRQGLAIERHVLDLLGAQGAAPGRREAATGRPRRCPRRSRAGRRRRRARLFEVVRSGGGGLRFDAFCRRPCPSRRGRWRSTGRRGACPGPRRRSGPTSRSSARSASSIGSAGGDAGWRWQPEQRISERGRGEGRRAHGSASRLVPTPLVAALGRAPDLARIGGQRARVGLATGRSRAAAFPACSAAGPSSQRGDPPRPQAPARVRQLRPHVAARRSRAGGSRRIPSWP